MKKVIAIVVMLVACAAGAQQQEDMPPVVTARITDPQRAVLDAADRDVDDAERILQEAKNKRADLETKIIQDHRDKLKLKWADCNSGLSSFVFTGQIATVPAHESDPKGYLSERKGSWIIFTRGYAICHGA